MKPAWTVDSTQAHYEQLADVYSGRANQQANERYRLECVEWLNPCRNILDVGCGTTNLLADLARDLKARTFGIDASFAMLATAPDHTHVTTGTAEYLPFSEHVVDGIVSINLLEHVTEPRRVFQELARVLKPGGRAVIVTPAAEWSLLLDIAERLKLKLPEGPHRFLDRRELVQAATAAGLNVVVYRRILLLPFGGKSWAKAMRKFERWTPALGFMHWLVAERSR